MTLNTSTISNNEKHRTKRKSELLWYKQNLLNYTFAKCIKHV